MKKICILLFILSLLLNLSESINYNPTQKKFYSKLLGMVRTEIIYSKILYLKNINNNILDLTKQMKSIRDSYKLNSTELTYLAYMWMVQNIKPTGNYYEEQDPFDVLRNGQGNLKGITSLFDKLCNYLGLDAGLISGFYKYYDKEGNILNDNYFWNFIRIDGNYYLIDILYAMTQNKEELGFGTDPEIFIYFHFPKEVIWQFLPQPITLEKFNSKALLMEDFYYLGFKTISPDSFEISGNEKIVLTYDESYGNDFIVEIAIMNNDYIVIEYEEYKPSKGKVEIKCNLKDELFGGLDIIIRKMDAYYTIAKYKINPSKTVSLN